MGAGLCGTGLLLCREIWGKKGKNRNLGVADVPKACKRTTVKMNGVFVLSSCLICSTCPGAWQARGAVHCCPISHQYCTRPGLPVHEELTALSGGTEADQGL
ncbi:hypothetical protein MHYP_G00022300 [Metynnis hypsauchen]